MVYLICDKCKSYYELQPGEKPEDFDLECECGGKFSTESPGYFESLLMDIEISKMFIRIYYKKKPKNNSSDIKIDHVEEYEISKIRDLTLVIQKVRPYLKFNYENKDISVKLSSKQAREIEKFLEIPENYIICPDENCLNDSTLDTDEICLECGKTSQMIPKEVYDKLVRAKRTNKMERDKKRSIERKKELERQTESDRRKRQNEIEESERQLNQLIDMGLISRDGIEVSSNYYNVSLLDYELKFQQFVNEAKIADILYKSYVTDSVSRLDKINGRFLAMQTFKLDGLIMQNNKIIELLQIISNKIDKNKDIIELLQIITNQNDNNVFSKDICPECGENLIEDQNCQKCGAKIVRP